MLEQLLLTAALLAMLSTSMLAGIYFIFSNTIMPSLKRTTAGVEVMQEINRRIQNRFFFMLFFGSAISSVVVITASSLISPPLFRPLLAFAALFSILAFLSTVLANVPLNNRLNDLASNQESTKEIWADYLIKWVHWNHVRVALCALSASLYGTEILNMTPVIA